MALWSFWLPVAALSLIVVVLAALGVLRGGRLHGVESGKRREMRIYVDQLREVERDQARGVLSSEEAERLHTETARRLLDADKQARAEIGESPAPLRMTALAVVVAAPVFAILLYLSQGAPMYPDMPLSERFEEARAVREARPSQTRLEIAWETSLPTGQTPEPDAQYLTLMAQLRAALAERPADLRGHRLLATNEANLGNFSASAAAWIRVIDIQGEDAPVEDLVALAETMVQATGGRVSPEAEVVLERILGRDPRNGPARYYLGLSLGQTGRPDMTFRLWRGLLEDSEPTDAWVPIIRNEIEQLAELAGVRYTLPEITAQGARGPTEADMAAAADMTEDERQAMIGSMVEGLASRLANQGGTPQEWARLIGALGTLGQPDRARAILGEARLVFAGQSEALALLEAAATRLGTSE